jgi:1-acyl-sn-glycerol-3-phosphate acyltransferase
LFFGPIGGIAVDRGKRQSLSEQIVEEFGKRDKFQLAITPEGTRKKNPEWKKGFYYIAKKAGVPILLTHLDYEKKELGINKIFYPTDNEAEDIKQIKRYFKDVKGRHPEQFSIGSAAND